MKKIPTLPPRKTAGNMREKYNNMRPERNHSTEAGDKDISDADY